MHKNDGKKKEGKEMTEPTCNPSETISFLMSFYKDEMADIKY